MPRVQMELLYDCGIRDAGAARRFLTRAIRAYGEFHAKGKAPNPWRNPGHAQQLLRACRSLRHSEINQEAYARFYAEEHQKEHEV